MSVETWIKEFYPVCCSQIGRVWGRVVDRGQAARVFRQGLQKDQLQRHGVVVDRAGLMRNQDRANDGQVLGLQARRALRRIYDPRSE